MYLWLENFAFSKPRESGFVNQSQVFNKGLPNKSIYVGSSSNSLAQSQTITGSTFGRENPVAIHKPGQEENFKFEEEKKQTERPFYPEFTFGQKNVKDIKFDKGEINPIQEKSEDMSRAPSFTSVIQQNNSIINSSVINNNQNNQNNQNMFDDFKF